MPHWYTAGVRLSDDIAVGSTMLGGMRGSLHESCAAQAGVHMHNMVANEWSVYDASLEIMRALVAALSGETRNLQGTTCCMLRPACDLQRAACNMQRALVATLSGTAHSMQRRRADAVRRSASHCTE